MTYTQASWLRLTGEVLVVFALIVLWFVSAVAAIGPSVAGVVLWLIGNREMRRWR